MPHKIDPSFVHFFDLGLGFAWEWETQYTITTINEGGSADKILMTGDKIIQVHFFKQCCKSDHLISIYGTSR